MRIQILSTAVLIFLVYSCRVVKPYSYSMCVEVQPKLGSIDYAKKTETDSTVVSGSIIDCEGESLIGATITIEGLNFVSKEVSDIEGNFSVNLPSGGTYKVVFSYSQSPQIDTTLYVENDTKTELKVFAGQSSSYVMYEINTSRKLSESDKKELMEKLSKNDACNY